MEATIETTNITRRDGSPPPAGEEADEIRGMMPSFHGWHEAQHALAFERAVAKRARDQNREPGIRRRWPVVLAAFAVVVAALVLERGAGPDATQLTAATPVNEMPWRGVDAPSGSFHVSLPAKPTVRAAVTVAGPGEHVQVRLQQTTVVVSAFAVGGPNQARELVRPILDERASALDGRVDDLQPVGSRAGEAFQGFVRTTTAVAIVRVIVNGAMLYVIELRGDVESQRARQIYNRVVLSFTAGS